MIAALSFDAAGTLIHLREPVGHGYAKVAARFDVTLDPDETTRAFRAAWKSQPPPDYKNGPAPDGDRGWWRALVGSVLDLCLGEKGLPADLKDEIFDSLYAHYALPESWQLYPEVHDVLDRLAQNNPQIRRLVISNFDPRLRTILAGHSIDHHFHHIVISSEIGAYKPDPAIFAHAVAAAEDHPPASFLHVGDDPIADIEGARNAGFRALHIDRPKTTLEAIFRHPNFPT